MAEGSSNRVGSFRQRQSRMAGRLRQAPRPPQRGRSRGMGTLGRRLVRGQAHGCWDHRDQFGADAGKYAWGSLRAPRFCSAACGTHRVVGGRLEPPACGWRARAGGPALAAGRELFCWRSCGQVSGLGMSLFHACALPARSSSQLAASALTGQEGKTTSGRHGLAVRRPRRCVLPSEPFGCLRARGLTL